MSGPWSGADALGQPTVARSWFARATRLHEDGALPSPRGWLPALHALRGLAALWVVLYHVETQRGFLGLEALGIPAVRFGWLGVDLFFVLSGFLLGSRFLRPGAAGRPLRQRLQEGSIAMGRFWWQRFWRIAPAYYIAWIVGVAVMMAWYPAGWRPWDAVANLFFLQNTSPGRFWAVNVAFWTLAVELQFYLLMPLMAWTMRGRRWPLVVVAYFALTITWRAWLFPENLFLATFAAPAFLGHFAIGIALAHVRAPRHEAMAAGAALLLIFIPPIVMLPAGVTTFGQDSRTTAAILRPLVAIGFALLIKVVAEPGALGDMLGGRGPRALGSISYSLYLIHIPMIVIADALISPAQYPWAHLGGSVALSVLAGWLLHRLVEAPAEARRRVARSHA